MPLDDFDIILGVVFFMHVNVTLWPLMGGLLIMHSNHYCFVTGKITSSIGVNRKTGGR